MTNKLKLVLASSLAVLFIGCGSSGSGTNVSKSDLKGNWSELCDVDTALGTSSQIISEISDDKIVMRTVEFDNLTCDSSNANNILFDLTVNFNYTIGDNFTTEGGKKANKINMTATGFNLAKGVLNGVPEVVGKTIYTLVYIENSKLYGGLEDSDHNATSEATRPVKIDFTDPAIKNN